MPAHRLEDLGRLRERLESILEDELFDYCNSKHDFENWYRLYNTSEKCEDLHIKLRHFNEKLHQCLCIAHGDQETGD